MLAWQHAITWVQEMGYLIDSVLPTTAPLRSKEDVQSCLELLDENTDVVITMKEASRSPWFNMVSEDVNGELNLLVEGNYTRRQDAPIGYDVTTVAYVLRRNSYESSKVMGRSS